MTKTRVPNSGGSPTGKVDDMASTGPQTPVEIWALMYGASWEAASTTRVSGAQFDTPIAIPTGPSWRSRLVTGVLLAAGVAVLAIGVTVRMADLHVSTVLSNSMQPTVSAGDVAVMQVVPTDSVRAGDVIAIMAPGSDRIVIHRVASLEGGVITTRGDANSVDDPWRITLTDPTADRLVAVVPYVGWLTELQRPALLLAGVLVALAILLELRKEVRKRLAKTRTQRQL